ncbi:ABC transporter permease/M1 family aminopeptidase [Sphingosinicella sp. LY1275]|uniref:ABC transporter permease/M1 family aminopeptidase n=1 Tax=Sphingosinicella sp. LY1275 TaxID=3095379 RepID=UPI002ADED3A9|nr:M1 family aminopeptidase [Sphingosinicella sp. LY1275]MEA1015966.1 ABC transporter permease [Sphingosinicella sp. LY1275]
MFARIAGFELRYQLRNPVFWVTAGIFFLLTFGAMTIDQIQMGDGGNVHKNASYATLEKHLILSLFFMFVTTAFVSNVVVRDDDTGFGPIVRSTRITKFDYLIGRFTGAFLAAALCFVAVPLAIWFGSLMPWVDPETLGPNRLRDYAYAYFLLALPNILITSAIFFALATVTRSMMTTYVGVVAFLVVYFVGNMLVRDQPEIEPTVALAEPFGVRAISLATRYWTAAERNVLLPDFSGPLLANRLLWIGISMLFLALAYAGYRFADKGMSKKKAKKQKLAEQSLAEPHAARTEPLPPARHGAASARAQLSARTRFEMKQVFKSPAFLVLIALGLFNSITALWMGGDLFGTPTIPVTRALIPLLQGTFSIIPIIIAVYYAGELVWRERDRKMHEIIDATPLPNWAYVVPKTMAVSLVLLASLAISVVAAILVQLLKGHSEIEFGKYLLWYILPIGFDLIVLAALAVFVQALSPNKYAGWGIMVLYIILTIVAANLGLEHNLYVYGQAPQVVYSDMNGAGSFWEGAWWFRLYWGAIALLLLVAAHLLWRRGTETRLKPRLQRAPARLRGTPGLLAGAGLAVALLTGGWIFYNTNILNEYRTQDDRNRFFADYEKKYLAYEKLPQPTISDVKLDVAIFPEERRVAVKGQYLLANLTDKAIRDVHVRNVDQDVELLSVDFPGARLASHDEGFGYRIYRLDRPMAPGETRSLSFETRRGQNGFRNSGDDTKVVENGTFLNNMEFAPAIGMDRMVLLRERSTRRKYDLPAELRPAKLEDLSATAKSYFGSGWSKADIIVSTAADQVPIAPGKKVSDVTRDGRRTARFVSDAPILTFFSVQSARYAEKHRQHAGVDLAVYYHPDHHWNVDRMLSALQSSLDYYQANFGPYQFEQARILEFPAYAQFAQAFANTMPYSESIGFVADNRDPDSIDYVTYVTAHELGHQYWAHQVIGADMQGGTMLSETLAQYSALMVMKKLYGEDKIRRFLKYELDRYLRERGGEAVEELPLARVENQPYIHYRKGSVAMYLLQERLGEDAVNRALRSLLDRYKFKGAPYPRSLDLIEALRKEAKTAEDQALITDLFERITLFDLKVSEPKAVKRADGKWDVTVTVEAKKFYADGEGTETEAKLADRIPIGLFTAEPGRGAFDRRNVLLMEKQPVRSGKQSFRFVTDRKPTHAGVDPYNFYIDRNSDDNVAAVS